MRQVGVPVRTLGLLILGLATPAFGPGAVSCSEPPTTRMPRVLGF
jgi:hypothetical protein